MSKLRIGKFLVSSNVNGPGRRFVIWFQGCHFRCRGCFNPEFWTEDGGMLMSVEEIISHIDSAAGDRRGDFFRRRAVDTIGESARTY